MSISLTSCLRWCSRPVNRRHKPIQGAGGSPLTQTCGQFELVSGQGRIRQGCVCIPLLVRNRSAEWADVVIGAELFGADGRALINRAAPNAGERLHSPYTIPPGETMYYLYRRDVARLNAAYASHKLAIKQVYAVDPVGLVQVAIIDQTVLEPTAEGAPVYLLRGMATVTRRCAEPLVVAAGFDAAGNLLDVAEALVYPDAGVPGCGAELAELAAGAVGYFTIEFLVPGICSVQARCVCL